MVVKAMRNNNVKTTNKRRHITRLNNSNCSLNAGFDRFRQTRLSHNDSIKSFAAPSCQQRKACQVLDEYGCLKAVNHSWLQLTRYKRDESIGRWFGEIMAPGDRSMFMKYLLDVGRTKAHSTVVVRIVREDGAVIFVSCYIAVRYGDYGICPQYYCEIEDITDSVLLNAELELEGDRLELSCVLENRAQMT
ncbi:MAG: PAS domain-containing protein [Geobacteraceae bacterium]|nr:PAS domain-containing protein [Geobacteraceae bacterium]